MVDMNNLRNNPMAFFIVGGVFIGIGVLLSITTYWLRSSESHSPNWTVGVVFFIIGGFFMIYGRRLRILQMVRRRQEMAQGTIQFVPAAPVGTSGIAYSTTYGPGIPNTGLDPSVQGNLYPKQPAFVHPMPPHSLPPGTYPVAGHPAYPPGTYPPPTHPIPDCPPPYNPDQVPSMPPQAPVTGTTADIPPPPTYAEAIR